MIKFTKKMKTKFEVGDKVRVKGFKKITTISYFLQQTAGGVVLNDVIGEFSCWNVRDLVLVRKPRSRAFLVKAELAKFAAAVMRAKRTEAGTWDSDGDFVWSKSNLLISCPGGSIIHRVEERRANANFIALADHHFDPMEEALRVTVDHWTRVHELTEISGYPDHYINKICAILDAIEKERAKP